MGFLRKKKGLSVKESDIAGLDVSINKEAKSDPIVQGVVIKPRENTMATEDRDYLSDTLSKMYAKAANADIAINTAKEFLSNEETNSIVPAIKYISDEEGDGPAAFHFYQRNSTGIDMQDPGSIGMQKAYNNTAKLINSIANNGYLVGNLNSINDMSSTMYQYSTSISTIERVFKDRVYTEISMLLTAALSEIKYRMCNMANEAPGNARDCLDLKDFNFPNASNGGYKQMYGLFAQYNDIIYTIRYLGNYMFEGGKDKKDEESVQASALLGNVVADTISCFTYKLRAALTDYILSKSGSGLSSAKIVDDLMSTSYDVIDVLYDKLFDQISNYVYEYRVLGLDAIEAATRRDRDMDAVQGYADF